MKAQFVAAMIAAAFALQAATFSYVIRIESRLTRLETIYDVQAGKMHAPPAPDRHAGL